MGIYTDGKIFGIRIFYYINDINILFEKIYEEEMTYNQMEEAYLFYTKLNNKNECFFNTYIKCTSTLDALGSKPPTVIGDKTDFMVWYEIPVETFIKTMKIKNI